MSWKPSNQPVRYDEARVARLKPIEAEIEKLGLPLIRLRKLNGIRSALEVQIEDGGDNPEVNNLLLDALRAGILHQVGKSQAQAVLRAIDAFEQAEAIRWEQVKAGVLPPIELTLEEQLDDLMQEGYGLIYDQHQTAAGCDLWLKAWELIKQMATPEMQTIEAFDRAYPGPLQSVFNWASDLEMELGNAGIKNDAYNEHRIRFVHEFLAQFPNVDDNRYINLRRAEGEALWRLGRQAEAETVYQALVEKLPDEAWAYIGWSDEYYLGSWTAKDYQAGEAVLLQALARPNLKDRADVLDRLVELYEEWGKPDKQAPILAELEASLGRKVTSRKLQPPSVIGKLAQLFRPSAPKPLKAEKPKKLKRNDPCWCGSGKKYKQCHMKSDMGS
jgi:hypothetical protein